MKLKYFHFFIRMLEISAMTPTNPATPVTQLAATAPGTVLASDCMATSQSEVAWLCCNEM